jgi:hypothetical protein
MNRHDCCSTVRVFEEDVTPTLARNLEAGALKGSDDFGAGDGTSATYTVTRWIPTSSSGSSVASP